MRKATIALANDTHHRKPVASLFFEKDYKLTVKVKSLPGIILCMRREIWRTVISSLAKIKSLLGRFFGGRINDINMLQK